MALSNKMPGKLGTYLTLGLAIFYVLVILILRKLTTNKINIANQNALAVIKKNLGEAHFNDLLERQRNYIDAYYDTLSAKEEAEASANEENVNELKETEETTEAEKEESNNNEEAEVEEKEVVETTEEASNETSKNK